MRFLRLRNVLLLLGFFSKSVSFSFYGVGLKPYFWRTDESTVVLSSMAFGGGMEVGFDLVKKKGKKPPFALEIGAFYLNKNVGSEDVYSLTNFSGTLGFRYWLSNVFSLYYFGQMAFFLDSVDFNGTEFKLSDLELENKDYAMGIGVGFHIPLNRKKNPLRLLIETRGSYSLSDFSSGTNPAKWVDMSFMLGISLGR